MVYHKYLKKQDQNPSSSVSTGLNGLFGMINIQKIMIDNIDFDLHIKRTM
jgi:hypothetical protein